MPSSISSSERLTAADRPGVAQPVPERPVPVQPWGQITLIALLLISVLTIGWEWNARRLGLQPGDLADSPSAWAEQRRRIDAGEGEIVLVGDSRILFDTDLDHFEKLTGVRPIQLALPGTNGRPFLEDLADDPDFKGLAIVGMAEALYFSPRRGEFAGALDRYHFESPADRSAWLLQQPLEQLLGFLDPNYRFSNLVKRLDFGWRAGPRGPYLEVWKVIQGSYGRQNWLWPRIESDSALREHAIAVWLSLKGPPLPQEIVDMTIEKSRAAVVKIRARGGDVVFLRPPSGGDLRMGEKRGFPRERMWDPLLLSTQAEGIHFEDFPQMQGLNIPELSHLSRACSTVFTDAYVRELARRTLRVQLRLEAADRAVPGC